MNTQAISVGNVMSRVNRICFAAVRERLVHERDHHWSEQRAMIAEREYRRFLCLAALHAGQPLVPVGDIDEFWHYHILDTRAYAEDCQIVLGRFLHHCPQRVATSPVEDATHRANFAKTCELYMAVFGEPYGKSTDLASCSSCDSSSCHGYTLPDLPGSSLHPELEVG
jgi:hypothetical protein